MTHTVRVMYLEGTNDEDAAAILDDAELTDEDSLIEVNFDTKYKIYDALSAIVELGYINPNFDSDLNEDADEAAWRLACGFRYDF